VTGRLEPKGVVTEGGRDDYLDSWSSEGRQHASTGATAISLEGALYIGYGVFWATAQHESGPTYTLGSTRHAYGAMATEDLAAALAAFRGSIEQMVFH
jgi:hypothetical protein